MVLRAIMLRALPWAPFRTVLAHKPLRYLPLRRHILTPAPRTFLHPRPRRIHNNMHRRIKRLPLMLATVSLSRPQGMGQVTLGTVQDSGDLRPCQQHLDMVRPQLWFQKSWQMSHLSRRCVGSKQA
jgi:hypothetical protein